MKKVHKDLRLGLIGAWGLRGAVLRHALLEPDVAILAAADICPDSLTKCQQYYQKLGQQIETTTDYRELLARHDIDAVFICTPDYLHLKHAIAALEAGKHVYLEKPMALNVADCDALLATAQRTQKKLFIGHNMRYFPVILKMKELLDSGVIGEIQAVWCRHFVAYGGEAYFKDWHSEQRYSNGLLLQKGAHDIDVIHWLCGSYSETVVGMGKLSLYDKMPKRQQEKRYFPFTGTQRIPFPPEQDSEFSQNIDVEDHNMIFMQLANGIQASYMHCMYTPTSERNYLILGSKGKLENIGDMGNCEVHVYTETREYREPNIIHKISEVQGEHGGSDPAIMKAFVRFIREDSTPHVSPVAARMAVAAGVAGTESLRRGNIPQAVAPLAPELSEYFSQGQKT